MNKFFLACLYLILSGFGTITYGQISGNEIYKDRYNKYNSPEPNLFTPVIVKDSILIVKASVLMNNPTDSFVVTLGLNQEAGSVKECNALINRRISAFKAALK